MRPRHLMPTSRESEISPVPRAQHQVEMLREARVGSLPNEATAAVYSCDASGVIQYYNNRAAELWGRRPAIGDSAEQYCGAFALYRPNGSHLPHDQCPMADVLNGKVSGVYDAEVHIERPDGTRVIVIVNIAPLIDDHGDIVGAVNSFCEITEREDLAVARE